MEKIALGFNKLTTLIRNHYIQEDSTIVINSRLCDIYHDGECMNKSVKLELPYKTELGTILTIPIVLGEFAGNVPITIITPGNNNSSPIYTHFILNEYGKLVKTKVENISASAMRDIKKIKNNVVLLLSSIENKIYSNEDTINKCKAKNEVLSSTKSDVEILISNIDTILKNLE